MTTLWATIVVIGILVFVHEFGHYLAARSVGVRVERFSVGFPPRLFSFISIPGGWHFKLFFFGRSDGNWAWKPVYEKKISRKKTGSLTEYCIALLPLGGYVKMAGIIDESMDTTTIHAPDELMSKTVFQQMWVMSAGVLMNLIIAFFIFSGLTLHMGIPEVGTEPVVSSVIEEMPAEKAGLLAGDRILSINNEPVRTWSDLTEKIHARPEEEISISWLRGNDTTSLSIVTGYQIAGRDGSIDTLGAIGIYPEVTYRPAGFIDGIRSGLNSTLGSLGLIVLSMKMLITGSASISDLGGPVMIAQMAGESAKAGMITLLSFMAFISVNLAFLNILPIPGLDGGHILVILVQMIIRRPLSIKTRLKIQQIGMTLLLLLFVIVLFNDISRLFTN